MADDFTEYCPCAEKSRPAAIALPQIAFADPCASYDQVTRGCTIHGRCGEADKVERGHAKSLTGCADFARIGVVDASVRPEQDIAINLPEHFNCSLAEWQGRSYLASRSGWIGRVAISELDANHQPVATWRLNTEHPLTRHGSEDPRLFVHRGRMHVSFSGYHRGAGTSQMYARLHDSLRHVEQIHIPAYEKAQAWEKNWQFFEYGGELHSVYTVAPQHVILRHDGDQAIEIARTNARLRWPGIHLRGGAPPVRVADEYYHWFHTVRVGKNVYEYGIGLYTFEARPPFSPARFVPTVMLVSAGTVPGQVKSVTFPCGAMLRGGKWLVSYGRHDCECRVAIWDARDIERKLR